MRPAQQFVGHHFVDIVDGLEHALAAVATLVAVAQFDSLVDAGAGAAGHDRAADSPAVQLDIDLDGRVAAAVKNLSASDINDFGHFSSNLNWFSGCNFYPIPA